MAVSVGVAVLGMLSVTDCMRSDENLHKLDAGTSNAIARNSTGIGRCYCARLLGEGRPFR